MAIAGGGGRSELEGWFAGEGERLQEEGGDAEREKIIGGGEQRGAAGGRVGPAADAPAAALRGAHGAAGIYIILCYVMLYYNSII